MNDIIKILQNNKKKVTIIGLITIAILIVIIVCLTISYAIISKEKPEEEILHQYLQEMGIDYYENYYYEQIGNDENYRREFLEKFIDSGIKIDLNKLLSYNEEFNQEKINAFKDPKTSVKCNEENSYIMIYPEKPYLKENYHFDVVLTCK